MRHKKPVHTTSTKMARATTNQSNCMRSFELIILLVSMSPLKFGIVSLGACNAIIVLPVPSALRTCVDGSLF